MWRVLPKESGIALESVHSAGGLGGAFMAASRLKSVIHENPAGSYERSLRYDVLRSFFPMLIEPLGQFATTVVMARAKVAFVLCG